VLEGWPTLPPRLHTGSSCRGGVDGIVGGITIRFSDQQPSRCCALYQTYIHMVYSIYLPLIDNFFLTSLFDDRHCCHRIHVFIFGTLSSVTGFLSVQGYYPSMVPWLIFQTKDFLSGRSASDVTRRQVRGGGCYPDATAAVKTESTTMQIPSSCQGAPSQLNLGRW